MELELGDSYKCPEGHKAKIVWISKNSKIIGVKCQHKHLNKILKVPDYTKSPLKFKRYPTKVKKDFVRNMVFLIRQ